MIIPLQSVLLGIRVTNHHIRFTVLPVKILIELPTIDLISSIINGMAGNGHTLSLQHAIKSWGEPCFRIRLHKETSAWGVECFKKFGKHDFSRVMRTSTYVIYHDGLDQCYQCDVMS